MLDSVNPTPADIRMIHRTLKTGSSTADELSTDDGENYKKLAILPMNSIKFEV